MNPQYISLDAAGRERFRYLSKKPAETGWEATFELAAKGRSAWQISRAIGKNYSTVKVWAARNGVVLTPHVEARDPISRIDPAKAAAAFMAGNTYGEIGQMFGVSRERVRQVLRKQGLTSKDGGMAASKPQRMASSAARAAARVAAMDAKDLERWGLTYAEKKEMRANGLIAAFCNQRISADARGISWSLTFPEWYEIWLSSGFLELRGTGKEFYCMSRLEDSGGYAVGNVEIKTNSENGKEAVKQWAGKQKPATGVFCLYPGTERPFIARHGKKQIGRYATEEEAKAERDSYVALRGLASKRGLGFGRGWTFVKRCKTRPYQVQIRGVKNEYFATQEEAEAYYKKKCAELTKSSKGANHDHHA